MSCDAIGPNITLLVYGELNDAGRRAIEDHLAACPACRVGLAEERRLHALLSVREPAEPTDDLLAKCREDLAAALRPIEDPAAIDSPLRPASLPRGWSGWWVRARPSPALAAALLILGFFSGWLLMGQGLPPRSGSPSPVGTDSMTTDLHSVEVDPGGERVNLTYDTRTRRSVRGRPEDPAIRRLLTDTVRDSSNAGLRLDAIGLLEGQAGDAEVRRALVQALRDDRNAGARLRALAALGPQASEHPEVRDAITDALLRDDNLGVRVRAIDALARTDDPRLAPLMRRLSVDDSEPYIRLRSGAIAEEMYARVKQR